MRHQGNQQKLAGYFETLQCRNCESSEIHGHSAQWLTDASQPIFLLTDANGQVAIEFFLEFGALTQSRALAPGAQIKVPVQFTARAAVANGPLKAVAQKQEVATLDAIGVVEAVTYEPPQSLSRYPAMLCHAAWKRPCMAIWMMPAPAMVRAL